MKRLLLIAIPYCLVLLSNVANAQYVFEVTTELDSNLQCTNWQTIAEVNLTWETDLAGDKVIHTSIPAPTGLTDQPIHTWYIPVEMANIPAGFTEAFYAISYDVTVVGVFPSQTILKLQSGGQIHMSWFRAKQGLMDWSHSSVLGMMKKRTGKPVPKSH